MQNEHIASFLWQNFQYFCFVEQERVAKGNSENALLYYHFNNGYTIVPEVALYVQFLSRPLLTLHRDCKTTYATNFILRLRQIYCTYVT
jgi:hypothetical protein